MNFAPMRPYVPETIIESATKFSDVEEHDQAQKTSDKYYSEVKRGILKVLNDNNLQEIDQEDSAESFALPRLRNPLPVREAVGRGGVELYLDGMPI